MKTQATINKGQRWSTAKAFIRTAIDRTNLHVATLAHVNKVYFSASKHIASKHVASKHVD